MNPAPRRDPWALNPDTLSFHQLATFLQDSLSLVDRLEETPFFRVERLARGARVDWLGLLPEEDPLDFPLVRISIHPRGTLLEAFSEDRLNWCRRRIDELGSWRITSDQLRILRVPDAIARPGALLQPIHDLGPDALESREVAEIYLRMAWPFLPREELQGRSPYVAIRTGRGRAAIEEILPQVISEIRRDIPVFPAFELEEIRALLLPPAARVPAEPEEKPHPARDRRDV
jgi:hypothetical protein